MLKTGSLIFPEFLHESRVPSLVADFHKKDFSPNVLNQVIPFFTRYMFLLSRMFLLRLSRKLKESLCLNVKISLARRAFF